MIEADQVVTQSLDQILGQDADGASLYERTDNLLRMFLFSRYPQRKPYAQRLLSQMYRTPISVETIQDGDILFAYISFNHVPKYVLVARYDISRTSLEEVPDEEEKKEWKTHGIIQHS